MGVWSSSLLLYFWYTLRRKYASKYSSLWKKKLEKQATLEFWLQTKAATWFCLGVSWTSILKPPQSCTGFGCMSIAVVKKMEQLGSSFGWWLLPFPTKPVNIDKEGYATNGSMVFLPEEKGRLIYWLSNRWSLQQTIITMVRCSTATNSMSNGLCVSLLLSNSCLSDYSYRKHIVQHNQLSVYSSMKSWPIKEGRNLTEEKKTHGENNMSETEEILFFLNQKI